MSFKIVYVEDDFRDRNALKEAIDKATKEPGAVAMECILVTSPADLSGQLVPDVSLIIADLWYPENGKKKPRWGLDEIITIVAGAQLEQQLKRPIPIIAYTNRADISFELCLKRRKELYDIWDKQSASPQYVAWRLGLIAAELSRYRPDAILQRAIKKMPSGARWHSAVTEMVHGYDDGWSESDQITEAGKSISNIAHSAMGQQQWSILAPLWGAVQYWEPYARASGHKVRGHARHVINVFWLGYWMLHSGQLRNMFESSWADIMVTRGNMKELIEVNALEALSDSWFYASIFHDIAQCYEHRSDFLKSFEKVFKKFSALPANGASVVSGGTTADKEPAKKLPIELEMAEKLEPHVLGIIGELSAAKEIQGELESLWRSSVADKKPDHGLLAAAYLRAAKLSPKYAALMREACRAMAMHNVIGKVADSSGLQLSWKNDPMTCLLALCDQLQSWDREVADEGKAASNWPEKSELIGLAWKEVDGRNVLCMTINYITPRHLEHAHHVRESMRHELINILRDKPNRALERIEKPWPFGLEVDFCLDRKSLAADTMPLRFTF